MLCKENAIIRKKQTNFYFSLDIGFNYAGIYIYFTDK
jgi:hypothetical protein